MDAITLLRNDHKTVEQLFKRFEKAGDGATSEKREIVDRIVEQLSVHAVIEEQVFYPVARATVPGTEDVALESLEEHHVVKWVLSELDSMPPEHERFDAKVTVLIESVRHHVKEEESDFFPKVRSELGRAALNDLGDALANAKTSAPTHPHPRSPDEPPANAVVGAIAGVVDRVTDNISGFAQGGVTAVQDLIARVLNNKKPSAAPTGSSVARSRATDVHRGMAAAADGAEETARRLASGTATTARTAAAGGRTTAASARNSARATVTAARQTITSAGDAAKRTGRNTTKAAKKSAASTAKAGKKKAASATSSAGKKTRATTRATTRKKTTTTSKKSAPSTTPASSGTTKRSSTRSSGASTTSG